MRSGNEYSRLPLDNEEQYCYQIRLEEGTSEELDCTGYTGALWKKILFYIVVVCTAGFPLLLAHWWPLFYAKATKRRAYLHEADYVVIQEEDKAYHIEKVNNTQLIHSSFQDTGQDSKDTEVEPSSIQAHELSMFRYFDFHKTRYYWDNSEYAFVRLRGLDDGETTCGEIHDNLCSGLTAQQHHIRLQKYSENTIIVQVKSYFTLLYQEVLNPFYFFQMASVALWTLDEYYIYAGVILLISVISLSLELHEIRTQSTRLSEMVSNDASMVEVYRNGVSEPLSVSSHQLVPGDVMLIPAGGCTMMCDAVLMAGNAIVNESMLTGESVPVTKTPMNPSQAEELYSADEHRRHTLFNGTKVIQTRYYGDTKVTAVVVRTGFSTAKGELVRSILHPKALNFNFYRDALKFIGFLAIIACGGVLYSIVILIKHHSPLGRVIIRSLDVITVVVPPALPAAMTIGSMYAQSRLKKRGIFCISPSRINICGKVKLFCFDKTGTLTEDDMDLWGVLPVEDNRFLHVEKVAADLPVKSHVMAAMATCHSLTNISNKLAGDPLDLKMFNAINWILEEPGADSSRFDNLVSTVVRPVSKKTYGDYNLPMRFEIGIIRQFTFSSSLQRMSVITRVLESPNMCVYCKGAPEKIESLCVPKSVPVDLHEMLEQYTQQGFRVLAMAYKELDANVTWPHVQRVSRDSIERDLNFLGLIIMENTLKPETTPVINELHKATIRTVMVTGDNLLTAVSVAHQCQMIQPDEHAVMVEATPPDESQPASVSWELLPQAPTDHTADLEQLYQNTNGDHLLNISKTKYHFVVSGRSYAVLREHFPDLLQKINVWGTVYARMSPEQKSQLIESLQGLGYYVGMCGDGANDCSALKQAHAGISLSEAEASVASPFTSSTQNIQCVPEVIKEGRAALVTSFGLFSFMALYSMVQFVSVLILYTNNTNLGDLMFLYIDLCITTVIAITMGRTAAYPTLVTRRPKSSLMSFTNLFSIITHIFFVVAFQVTAYYYLTTQTWFKPVYETYQDGDESRNHECWETAVVFLVSCYQYVTLSFVFSKGPPFRKRIWTNVPYAVALVLLISFNTYVLLYPADILSHWLELKQFPENNFSFRLVLLAFVGGHFVTAWFIESVVAPSQTLKRVINVMRCKKQPKSLYKTLEHEMTSEVNWPPVGTTSTATTPVAVAINT